MQFETTATQSLAKPVNGRQKENGITGFSLLISPFWFLSSEFYCTAVCSNYLRSPLLEFLGRAEWVGFFALLNFFFESTTQYYNRFLSFLPEGGGGGGGRAGSFFLLTLRKNLFRNKSVCSIFSSKIIQLPFCQKSAGRLLTRLVRRIKISFRDSKIS